MIVPADSEKSTWMFMKPFTVVIRLTTTAILTYTAFIIWFLEHQSNPEFKGSSMNQMGTVILFTFSSLFFAHREKVCSNLTRLLLVIWLFVVLILNSSYTASLAFVLTILLLKRNNLRVWCDGDSIVSDYLKKLLEFKSDNIENINRYRVRHQEEGHGNLSLWRKTIALAKYVYNWKAVVESGSPPPPPTSADIDEDWRALSWVSENPPRRAPESFPHDPDDHPRISESFPHSPDETRIHEIQLTFLNSVPR